MSMTARPGGSMSIQRLRLVQLLAKGATRSDACRASGISRSTFYSWLRNSPEFRDAVQDAEGTYLARGAGAYQRSIAADAHVPAEPRPAVDGDAGPTTTTTDISVPPWLATLVVGIAIVALFSFLFAMPGT